MRDSAGGSVRHIIYVEFFGGPSDGLMMIAQPEVAGIEITRPMSDDYAELHWRDQLLDEPGAPIVPPPRARYAVDRRETHGRHLARFLGVTSPEPLR